MRAKTRRRGAVAALLILLAAGQAESQSRDWYYNKTIRKIEFSGLKSVKSADMDAVTKQFVGRSYTDELFSEILSRIYALEYFDDVSPAAVPYDESGQTITLRFTVVERPVVTKILFGGNKDVRTTDLKNQISLKERDIFVASKVLLDERALREYYLKSGFTNVSISSRVVTTDAGIEVSFVINEGRATVVSAIRFQGNTIFTARKLKSVMESKEKNLLRKGAFQESALQLDRLAIATYYQDRGYADAAVTDVMQEAAFNEKEGRNEITLTYIIHEGIQYTYGGITISGNRLFPTETLTALIRIKEGTVFNQTRFQQGLMAIADLYFENGYTSNSFIPGTGKDSEKKQITATLEITERERSHIEHIVVRGNTKTKTEVVTREIPLESGDIFSKAKLQSGLRNLLNLQYFSAIVPEIIPGSEDNLVDVIINVEEQSTMSLEFGLTFSGVSSPEDFPVSLFVKFQESNFFGTGKTIGASTTLSPDVQSGTINYGESWWLNLPLGLSLSADVSHKNLTALQNVYFPASREYASNYMNYSQLSFSGAIGVGRRWFPNFGILSLSGGLTVSLLRNYYDARLFEPVDTTIAEYEDSWGWRNTLWTAFSVDDRDINYDPSRGWFASQRVSWTGFLPRPIEKEFFLRTDTKGEIYFTLLDVPITDLWRLKVVLMEYAGLSFMFPPDRASLGESSMLYVDGMFNGRGWMSYAYNTRGKAMFSNIMELRMPLLPGLLAFDFFFDTAVVKYDHKELFNGTKSDDFLFSFGPGLRFAMPQFPLRLMIAFAFKTEDGSVRWLNSGGSLAASSPQPLFVLSFSLPNR
jgi:outer membrane protein insertion porin family